MNKVISSIHVSCPGFKGRYVSLGDCQKCPVHGGTISAEFVQYPDGNMREKKASDNESTSQAMQDVSEGKAKVVNVPVQIICGQPLARPLEYVWTEE